MDERHRPLEISEGGQVQQIFKTNQILEAADEMAALSEYLTLNLTTHGPIKDLAKTIGRLSSVVERYRRLRI